MQVGLKALPLNLHLQFLGFLPLGDMNVPLQYVHMHITLTGEVSIVKDIRPIPDALGKLFNNILSFYKLTDQSWLSGKIPYTNELKRDCLKDWDYVIVTVEVVVILRLTACNEKT
jgi:hypothetical protein